MNKSAIISLLMLSTIKSNPLNSPDRENDTLPVMFGSPTVPTTATTSCFACIRGGWIWCSAKWHYEEPIENDNYNASTDDGTCCFDGNPT